jgi:hypothetical protein
MAVINLTVRAQANELNKITQGFTNIKAQAQSAAASMRSFGASISNTGKLATAGITAPLIGAATAATKFASDANESLNKVTAVFKEQSAAIVEWSQNSAEGFGLAQQQALEAAGTFGNLFTSMGLNREAAAGMAQSLTELAADIASFNNITVDESLEKLRAGLVGEVEPLRTVGVALSAAAVEAFALEQGMAASKAEITEAIKIQARYALILEQTKNQQGDFKNTSDEVANATRILKAEFIDVASSLGQTFLPLTKQAIAGIRGLLDSFSNLSPQMQTFIVAGGAAAAALGPLLIVLGSVVSAIGTLVPLVAGIGAAFAALVSPVGLAVGALAALFALDVGGIRTISTEVAGLLGSFAQSETVTTAIGEIKSSLADLGAAFGNLLSGELSFAQFTEQIQESFGGIAETIRGIFDGPEFAALSEKLSDALGLGQLAEMAGPLVQDLQGLGAAFVELGAAIATAFPGGDNEGVGFAAAGVGMAALDAVMQALGVTAEALGGQLRTVVQALTELVSGFATITSGALEGDLTKVTEGVMEVFSGLETLTTGTLANLTTLFEGFSSTLTNFAKGAAEALGFPEIAKQIDAIQTKVSEAWLQIKDSVEIIIETFSWSDFIKSFKWPTLPRFSWNNFIKNFRWPSLPSFSWGSFITGVNLRSLIPSFPGWGSVFSGFNPFGSDAPATNATGTLNFPGGLTWVGERGPELIAPPRGSRIFNSGDSMALAGAGGDTIINFYGDISSELDLNSMAHQVADILNRRRR